MSWQAGLVVTVLVVGIGALFRFAMRSSSEYRSNPGEANEPFNRHGTNYDASLPGD